jgi:carbon storage regulator
MNTGNLVVTRRPNESVQIGSDVVVTVLAIHGNQVRISIRAPKDVHIVRTELLAEAPINALSTGD